MASKKVPEMNDEPGAFLSMVDARIQALQTLRASYVAAVSIGALGSRGEMSSIPSLGVVASGGVPVELPRGAFLNKSLPAAVRLYLSAVKRKQSIREIATALKNGGVETTSGNFENVITGALNRMKNAGDVLRFDDGWALAEFYPENLRSRLMQGSKPTGKVKGNGGKKRGRPKGRKPKATALIGGPTLAGRIEAYLREHGKPARAAEIASVTDAKMNVLGLALGRLKKSGRVTQNHEGAFSLA